MKRGVHDDHLLCLVRGTARAAVVDVAIERQTEAGNLGALVVVSEPFFVQMYSSTEMCVIDETWFPCYS